MNVTWEYVKPLKNSYAIKDYLRKYSICLPDELIDTIERYNGGRPSEKRILTAKCREYVFKALLSYNEEDRETIYNVYPELFSGTALYPIGSDVAGNFICYDINSMKYVLYNHETEDVEAITYSIFGGSEHK